MREILLNDSWNFMMPHNTTVTVNIPHTWNGIDGQDGGNDYKRCKCKYIKTFKNPKTQDEQTVLAVFEGVNSEAEILINGVSVARHSGGYSTFIADLTPHIKDINYLEVVVGNEPNPYVYPQVADFTFYGGIYRDVKLQIYPKNHFAYGEHAAAPLKITATVNGNDGIANVKANIKGTGEVSIIIEDADGNCVAKGKCDEDIKVANVNLWNGIKNPYLYTVKAQLTVDGKTVDTAESKIGFRSFYVDPQKGFFLNGKSYPLRGVCRHQDRPMIGNAITCAEHEEDMRLILEMGANTIRLAHYQHSQYFYDLCDKYGIVVWAEIPYISKHEPKGNDNTVTQMYELIVQNYNHPSICFWGLSNEITMFRAKGEIKKDRLQNHKILNELCHKLDPTRLTTLACFMLCGGGNKLAHISDVVSWNLYFGWYAPGCHLTGTWFSVFKFFHRKRSVGLAEYGAEAMTNLHSVRPRRHDNTEEYQAIFHEKLLRVIEKRPYLWATHVWNMFDFAADGRNQGGEPGRNHKGLVTFDRKIKKDSFYIYKAHWSDEKFIHICGSRFVNRTGKKLKIKVYSNLPEITLYNNGKKIKTLKADKIFKFTLPMQETNLIEAKYGDYCDKITVNHVKKKDTAYIEKNLGSAMSWQK